ncbi:MAG: 1-(5-phosphoribosyl)-5-[(5-phosphoribosylamino)methylideneamino]imidazole-4-carboxamide isomerase [Bacteroidota bacterium]
MDIVPAIDLIDGKCVRLHQGAYDSKTIYNENPLEQALMFQDQGFSRLHMVDLDGAKAGETKNLKVLEKITSKTNLVIDYGGGVRSGVRAVEVLDAGARMVNIGSMAVKNTELFDELLEEIGQKYILLGLDVRNEKLATDGWTNQTEVSIFDFLEERIEKGLDKMFCTDISKDGTLQGPSVELYTKLIDRFPNLQLIASGGVGTVKDLVTLKERGLSGAIVGKAFYEGKISIEEISEAELI